jgi:small subunit ribosomal protein S9
LPELVEGLPIKSTMPEAKEHKPAVHAKVIPKKYFEAVGRRKTSIARVRIMAGEGVMTINDKTSQAYFPLPRLQAKVNAAAAAVGLGEKMDVSIRVLGGGITSQAEAIRHGISRALIIFNPTFRKRLKAEGFLTRDSRMVERKKYGLKKARRAPQWQKR